MTHSPILCSLVSAILRKRNICKIGVLLLTGALSLVPSLVAQDPAIKTETIETEDLVLGKEGRNYHYKKLFRRGQDRYETYTVKGQQVQIEQTPVIGLNKPQFVPEFSGKQDLLRDFRSYGANDFVELFFEMKEFPANADTLYILNRLLQMETMTGTRYFSTRQQEMTTYITSCYIVDAAKSKEKQEPPQFRKLPTEPIRIIIRQDDNRFTATWYDVTIRVGQDGSLRMTMNNITPIYVQFIFYFKAIDAQKVRHEIVILPNKDQGKSPLIYALSQIHNERTRVMGIELDLGNSFNRRMSGVQGWISQRIYPY
ncbi:hypothetical protein P0082_09200 [Candidatus Haliotispira prima]|uniref:Sigma E regulatory protein, MucB/RseB n=1 Tax=Candidatus Haliotispira prima TaxID=3034016 RepID=A0ABY8MF84_9SPIO|nr:hypothetical protein P0082_09200 [Candidatus Haliotispira prima]